MKRHLAKEAVNKVLKDFEPHVRRIDVVGSYRRECEEVNDLDFILIPKPYDIGMFASGIGEVLEQDPSYKIIKGKLGDKYIRFELIGYSIEVDLYFAIQPTYGLIKYIRTGPKEANVKLMQFINKKTNYKVEDGCLIDKETGKIIPVDSEMNFCHSILWQYVDPNKRKEWAEKFNF